MKEICYLSERAYEEFSAGSKARNDIDDILAKQNFRPINIKPCRMINKFSDIVRTREILRNNWRIIENHIGKQAILIIQYPLGAYFGSYTINNYNIRKLKKEKGVTFIGLLHDIVHIQEPLLVRKVTEIELLKQFDYLICHNQRMKDVLIGFGIAADKLISLDIFDYLAEPNQLTRNAQDGITVAGNLMRRKAGYIYKLANKNVKLNLYGPNYDGKQTDSVTYHGSLPPEQLIQEIKGAYSLIWDGPDLSGCNGPYGRYQKINNPHRVSMSLAAKMPLIINQDAALSKFVSDNKLGLVVDSLEDIAEVLNEVSEDDYREMVQNVSRIAEDITAGKYTLRAVRQALDRSLGNGAI